MAALIPRSFSSQIVSADTGDPNRPQFHLLPAANWMNDPCGPIYWKGKYHMFYQYNPNSSVWGDMHWGHAVSPDMVHWSRLPVALAPTPGGPDEAGCFTGSAVVKDGVATILYTGVVRAPDNQATIRDGVNSFKETQCIATSTDADLTKWTKQTTPVIARPPAGLKVLGFRDPAPWQDGDWWYVALASGIANKGARVLLYRSKDLRQWSYLHPLAEGTGSGKHAVNPVDSGDMWECPDFFPLGDAHVLIYATAGKVHWQSGELDKKAMRFHSQQSGLLDHGSYYAAKTQLDADGNRILWGWITEDRPVEDYRAAGWAGAMSLPRKLTLDKRGRVAMRVLPAVESLRGPEQNVISRANKSENEWSIKSSVFPHLRGEILCEVRTSEGCKLSLIGSENGSERKWISVKFDPRQRQHIMVDNQTIPIALEATGPLQFRMFVDGSVLELFVNNQEAYTKRIYTSAMLAPDIRLDFEGNTTNLKRLSVWQYSPIFGNR